MHKFLRSFGFALDGIISAFKTQPNFRFHCVATLLVVILGVFLKISAFEWLWLALAIAMVLAAELLNTAIESLTDLASPNIHPLAKRAKDTAAAAVLVIAAFAIAVAAVILLPKLLSLLV
ncbi:diacylglycerol kinase family protein [Olivibacter sitiensis]|uniref:diacylglycerol kinase family protein n=1 Tax=Olivibacter sitiensis TaxID=376470 RepID=UPI00040ECF12|nr:diacylglycerol kinase family protein [Olivibacter sitiensis]